MSIPPAEPAAPDRRRACGTLAATAAAACLASWTGAARAQEFPSKPFRIIVPAGVGTVGDIMARLLATHMSRSLGQPFVVENIPAAGGIPGTSQLVRAPKDGYTLCILSNNHVINPSIYKNIPYDPIRDITPIGIVGSTPLVLVVNPAVPATNLKELLALARARPDALTYGSAGNGTVLHLAGVLLTSQAGVQIRHVPYSASAQMTTDVIAGQVDMVFLGVASAAPHIQAGRLRAIGVTTKERSPVLPNVPTLAESGLPNYDFDGWLTLVGPPGLPRPIVDRLNAELRAALALKEVQDTVGQLGVRTVGGTPEQTAQFIKTELEKHTELARRGGAKLE